MSGLWDPIKTDPFGKDVPSYLKTIEQEVINSQQPARITFGTSGWRGIIGESFTLRNVRIATQAIVEMMKTPAYLQETGLPDFTTIQKKGLLIGRDTRFLGESFAQSVAEVLAANEIHAHVIEREAVTPDLSLTVVQKGFAGSINLTPSHNPFDYEGIKFNPADGGTADSLLTTIIEDKAAKLMETGLVADYIPARHEHYIHAFESLPVYVETLQANDIIDFDFIFKAYSPDIMTFMVDNVHGASAGYLEKLLNKITFTALRHQRDVLFGGAKPEPSSKNMKDLFAAMQDYDTPLKLGVILDPDGDRVRFMDGINDIDMNHFGAVAFHYLVTQRQFPGGVAKSVATSNLVNAIASELNRPVFETAVGFKNFRQYLKADQVACAFEESDGITLRNHVLEKDGLIGALLALEITLRTKKPLGDYVSRLQKEYGPFYPRRFSSEITPAQKESLTPQLEKYQVGDTIEGREISRIITVDGFKFIFSDQSWLMIRPSGTEPKVRIYVEARREEDAEELFRIAKCLI